MGRRRALSRGALASLRQSAEGARAAAQGILAEALKTQQLLYELRLAVAPAIDGVLSDLKAREGMDAAERVATHKERKRRREACDRLLTAERKLAHRDLQLWHALDDCFDAWLSAASTAQIRQAEAAAAQLTDEYGEFPGACIAAICCMELGKLAPITEDPAAESEEENVEPVEPAQEANSEPAGKKPASLGEPSAAPAKTHRMVPFLFGHRDADSSRASSEEITFRQQLLARLSKVTGGLRSASNIDFGFRRSNTRPDDKRQPLLANAYII